MKNFRGANQNFVANVSGEWNKIESYDVTTNITSDEKKIQSQQ